MITCPLIRLIEHFNRVPESLLTSEMSALIISTARRTLGKEMSVHQVVEESGSGQEDLHGSHRRLWITS